MADRRNKISPWERFASKAGEVDFTNSVEWNQLRAKQEEEDRRRIESAGRPNTRGRYISERFAVEEDTRPEAQRYGSAVIDAGQGGLQRSAAGFIGQGAGAAGRRDFTFSDINPFQTLSSAGTDLATASINKLRDISPWYDEAVSGALDWMNETGGRLMDAADANSREVERQTRNMQLDWVDQGVLDLAGSLTSMASVIGGPFAAVGAADVQGQEYVQGRRAGLSHEDALTRAKSMGAVEMGTSLIPTGKLLTKIPFVDRAVNDVIQGTARKWVTRTANQAVGEGLQESTTALVQMGVDANIANNTENPQEVRDFAASQLPKNTVDFFNQMRRNFVAGALGGASLGQAEVHNSMVADAGKLVNDMYWAHGQRKRPTKEEATQERKADEQRAMDPVDAWLRSPLQERGEQLRQVNVPDAAALRADAERVAGTMPVRQPDLPQDAEDFNRMPVPGVSGFAPYRATPAGAAQTAEQATAARDINAIARENERLAAAVTARQGALVEGQAALTAQERADRKAANDAARAADRKFKDQRAKARGQFVQEAMKLPTEQRVQYVADQMQQWDATNTKPEPTVTAPQATTTRRPASEKLRAAYKENFPDLDDAAIDNMIKQDQESAGDLKRRVGLADDASWTTAETSTPEVQKVTPEQLIAGIAGKVGDKRANIIAKMIGDGKVVIDTGDIMPINPRVRGAYVPRTGKIHINADRVNADNIVGEVLSILAHEVKHGGDIGGDKLPASLGDFIGREQSTNLTKKIVAAANAGNPLAKQAVDAARKGPNGNQANVFNLEVPAYFIQRARDARSQRGIVARLTGDIVSGVRTAAKRISGIDDVNLNDVAYMSDRLLEAAARGENFTAQDQGAKATIMGASAADFAQREADQTTYLSADGTKKFVISDIAAKLKPKAVERLLELKADDAYRLEDIFEHEELYRNYPQAREIPVTLMQGTGRNNAFAQYSAADPENGEAGYIELDPKMLRGERTESDVTSPRVALIHEIQHWIQDQEGRANDFFDEGYMDKPAAEQQAILDYELAREENDALVDQIIKSPVIREAIKDRAAAVKVITNPDLRDHQKAYQLMSMALENDPNADVIDLAEKYNASRDKYNESTRGYNEAQRAAKKRYLDNITEQEAFFSQNNANVPQERLPINPEERFMQERGQIDVPSQQEALAAADNEAILERLSSPDINTKVGRAMQLAKAQFLYTSGIGKDIYDRLQLSVGEAAVDAQRGMNAGANIEAGISKLAKRTGQSVDDARNLVRQRMDSIAKLPSPEARQRALDALVRQYPEMRALNKAYSDIADLTKTLVRQMLEANPNPTQEDVEFMQGLLDNSFGYTTRMYAAYQGEAGSEYSRKLYNDYNDAIKRASKNKKLSADQKLAMTKIGNAINYLAKADLTIPNAENIGKAKIEKIRYLYDQWIGDSSKAEKLAFEAAKRRKATDAQARTEAHQKLEQELLNFAPTVDTATVQARAKDAVDAILGVTKNTGSVPQYLRTASADRGILQKRQELPVEIRELLGEITDPRTRVAATLAKQGELAARTKFLQWLRDNKEGVAVVSPQTPSGGKFTATLEGDGFGPLKGWKTTPQIEAVLNDQLGMFSSLSDALAQGFAGKDAQDAAWYSKFDRLVKAGAGAAKVASVILEGYGTLMNLMGALVIPIANGVYNPKYWARGASASADIVKNEFFNNAGELKENTKRAVRLGVVDSAKVNELRDSVQRRVRDEIAGKGPITRAGRAWGWTKRLAIESFAQADVWPKIAALDARIDMLTQFYKAEGIEKSAADIEAEAATAIKDTNISADRVPPFIKALESRGITTFLPYFYNVPRSLVMNTAHGLNDFVQAFSANTAEGRMIKGWEGLKRVSGTGAVTYGLVQALSAWAAAANGEDEDDVEEMKKVMRPDARYGNPVYLGKDEGGAPLFFRLSRFDPYGPVNDMLKMLMDPETTQEEAAGAAWDYMKDLAFANRYTKVVVDTLSNTVGDGKFKDRTVRLERIAPETVSILKEAARAMNVPDSIVESSVSLADTLLPGQFDVLDPDNPQLAKPKNEDATRLANTTRWLGGKLDRANPISRSYEIGAAIKEARDRGRRINNEYQGTGRVDAAMRLARETDEAIHDSMMEAVDLYDGMVNGLGYSKREAMDTLKTGGFDAKDISLIVNGRVPGSTEDLKVGELSRIFSKKSLEQRNKYRDTMLSREERIARRKERAEYLKELREREAQTEE